MAVREYNNKTQERGYQVLLLLAGHELEGVTPGDLAKAVKTLPSNITNDLRVLQKAGLAEPLPHDPNKWRLGPRLVQIANAHKAHMEEFSRRFAEVSQRYSRLPG